MGQDLLLEGFVRPANGFDIDGAVALLPTLSPTDLEDWVAERWGSVEEQEEEGSPDILAGIETALRVLATDDRQAGTFTFVGPTGSVTLWITGGQSWGDSPTDEFDEIRSLHFLPLNVVDTLLRRKPDEFAAPDSEVSE